MTIVAGAPVPLDVLADPDLAADAYYRWVGRTGLADETKRAYAREVANFVTWIGEQDKHRADEVFTDPYTRDYAVRDYRRHLLAERKRATKGVGLSMTALGSVLGWCGLGPPSVKFASTRQQAQPKALSQDQARDVMRAAERRGPRDLALLAVGVGTGLRVAEIAALDVDDVWVSARAGAVQVRAGKGDRPRTVPLNAQTRQALDVWLAIRPSYARQGEGALFLTRSGRRLAVRSIRHTVAQVGKQAQVTLSPHVLRHTFGTNLVRDGTDLVVVAELMGHSSVETTRIYSRPSAAEAALAVESAHIDYR